MSIIVKGNDKRKEHRAPLGTKVSWTLDSEQWYEDNSENISTVGMMLWTERPVNEGSSIKLRFKLPNLKSQGPVTINAEVVRIVQRNGLQIGLGLEFLSLQAGNYEKVKNFVFRILGLPTDTLPTEPEIDKAAVSSFKIEHLTRKVETEENEAEKKSAAQTNKLQRHFMIRLWSLRGIKFIILVIGILTFIKAADFILKLISRL